MQISGSEIEARSSQACRASRSHLGLGLGPGLRLGLGLGLRIRLRLGLGLGQGVGLARAPRGSRRLAALDHHGAQQRLRLARDVARVTWLKSYGFGLRVRVRDTVRRRTSPLAVTGHACSRALAPPSPPGTLHACTSLLSAAHAARGTPPVPALARAPLVAAVEPRGRVEPTEH